MECGPDPVCGESCGTCPDGKKTVVALITVAVLVLFTLATVWFLWIGAPTDGPDIGRYDNPQTALLVVDLQEDFTGPGRVKNILNADDTVRRAGDLVAQAVATGRPVAYIRAIYESPVLRFMMGGLAAPDEPGSRMDARLPSLTAIPVFTKTRGDAFSNPDLDRWLRDNRVDHVVIVGIDAFYCVDDTINGALNRGYKVTAAMDAISTGTSRDIKEIAAKWKAAGVNTELR